MAELKNTTIGGTAGANIPSGTTAQRPGSPSQGMIRYNTDYGFIEVYNGSEWRTLDNSVVAWSIGADIKKVDNEVVHIWRDTGTAHRFYVTYGGSVRSLVVGGGGSGGTSGSNCSPGGGGAGGYVETTVTESSGSTTNITVGAGGVGGNNGAQGGDNSFLGNNGDNSAYGAITGYGGGGGGGGQGRDNGRNGGSGGGAAHPSGTPGNATQPSQPTWGGFGHRGGFENNVNPEWGGGGGGGAGENGLDGRSNYGALGGSGRMSAISGESVWYAGGGGGGGCQQGGSRNVGISQFSGQPTASGTNAGEGGLGGGGMSNQQWGNDYVQQRFRQGAGAENTGGGGAAGGYNSGGVRSGNGATGVVIARYRSKIVNIGRTADNPAQSASQIKSYNPDSPTGLYYIKPTGWSGAAQQIFCDMEHDGGGWMLVASNNAGDSTIPVGNNRQSTDYELDRSGVLGTANPDNDYIIGSIINNLPFSQARVWAWGFDERTTSRPWPYDIGAWVKAFWGMTTTGVSRLTEVRDRFEAGGVTGTGFHVRVYSGGQTAGRRGYGLSGSARYYTLDGIKADRLNGGYAANVNQTTIGGVGVAASDGDPDSGCYLGHGSNEGSYSCEGWYDSHNNQRDCRGYTTWVR